MKQSPGKANVPSSPGAIRQALLGLYGIAGISLSMFGGFKVPFAESNAKDYWRHALAGIILIVALIAGAISLALYMFNANYFKSQIVDYVKINNQRDLTLEGDLNVTFFPKLGLDAGKMTISQRNSNKTFASVEDAHFYVAWWPLILKQLQVESVLLKGLHANVIRYKNGTSNLDDLFSSQGNMGDIKFEIDSLKLVNSSLNLQDEAADLLFSLHDLNVETGKLADTTPGTVTANFRLESIKPAIDCKIKLSSHLLFDFKNNLYELENFEGETEGEAVGISNLALNFQGSFKNFPAAGKFYIDKFSASLKGKLDNRKLDTKLDIPKLHLDKMKWAGTNIVLNTTLLQEEENLNIGLELPAFEIADNKLTAANMSANFDLFKSGRTLQGKLNSPFNLDLSSRQLELSDIASNFSVTHPLLSKKITANLNGNMQANIGEQHATLNLKSKIDDSTFVGNIGVRNFVHPEYSFDIAFNTLDLDRYLATDFNKRLQDDALPFDFSGLKDLNMHGKLRSGEVKFANLQATNLVSDIKVEQSSLLIEPLGARLYGGAMLGSISITASDTPKITFRQKLNGIQLHTMLADLLPGNAKLAGTGNLAFDLNGTGNNMGDLRRSLAGNASLALRHGSIAGINIAEALLEGKEKLGLPEGIVSRIAKFGEVTSFSELKSTFEFKDGQTHSDDFSMKSPTLSSKGEGEINLSSGLINYHFNTAISGRLKSKINGGLAELKGISIPMRLEGPYGTPSVILEFSAASGGKLAKIAKTSTSKTTNTVTTKNKPGKK